MKEIVAEAGDHVGYVIEKIIKEAPAFTIFNGVRLEANKHSTYNSLSQYYHKFIKNYKRNIIFQ